MISEMCDGVGIIWFSFDFGINMDLVFIEVNEKIDVVMNYLFKDIDCLKVIKVSVIDILVFYLNLILKIDSVYEEMDQQVFLNLCEFLELVIKCCIEQLLEVVMVDVIGLLER